MNNTQRRIEKLEQQARPTRWIAPVVFYDPEKPGDLTEKSNGARELALRNGWDPATGAPHAILMPKNGRE